MKTKGLLIILLSTALLGCEKKVVSVADLKSFDEVSANDLYEYILPADQYDYFEIRYAWCGSIDFETKYSRGSKCIYFQDSALCVAEIDSLISDHGFHWECLPGCCAYYVVAQLDQINLIYDSVENLKTFLGAIDSKSDALFYAFSEGYYYKYDSKNTAAIKEVDNGYQIIALKMVNYCDPIQVDKFLLEITYEGEINILEQKIYDKTIGACI